MNSYEYYLSYKNSTKKSTAYLNIGYFWWLLNSFNKSSNVWRTGVDGSATYTTSNDSNGIRPMVNLKNNVKFVGGSGTKDDPYTILGDKEEATLNTTLLNTRTSGEYVIFDEDGNTSTKELYRIISVENGMTKINKNDYIKNGTSVLTKMYSTSITFGSSTSDEYWDYYLNNTWYTSLVSKSMLDKGTYYIKRMPSGSYKNSLCNTNNTTETINDCVKTTSIWNSGYVGLPRYGEMFASQQGDEGYSSSKYILFITPYSSSSVWNAFTSGYGSNSILSDTGAAVRPSLYLKSTVKITGGDGTKSNPFTIALK